jgi:hypothetical protein
VDGVFERAGLNCPEDDTGERSSYNRAADLVADNVDLSPLTIGEQFGL